jgi:hypothetical protein
MPQNLKHSPQCPIYSFILYSDKITPSYFRQISKIILRLVHFIGRDIHGLILMCDICCIIDCVDCLQILLMFEGSV